MNYQGSSSNRNWKRIRHNAWWVFVWVFIVYCSWAMVSYCITEQSKWVKREDRKDQIQKEHQAGLQAKKNRVEAAQREAEQKANEKRVYDAVDAGAAWAKKFSADSARCDARVGTAALEAEGWIPRYWLEGCLREAVDRKAG